MKIKRSTKCTLKYLTAHKRDQLNQILTEYQAVVNFFIDHFWPHPPERKELLKPVVDLPSTTWLSARLRKVAAREAIDLMKSALESAKALNINPVKPIHAGKSMHISSTIATLSPASSATEFDAWLHLSCIGNQIQLDIPIRLHKHYHSYAHRPNSKRCNDYIISLENNYVQFVFEINTGPKRQPNRLIGVDTGINALATLSTGEQLGQDIKQHIDRVNRCKQNSKGQQRARRALKQRIAEVAKQVTQKADLIVLENLKNITKNTKKNQVKRRLTKNMRRRLSNWQVGLFQARVKQGAELNRVSFRSVSPFRTSITCHVCGLAESGNRDQNNYEIFKCQNCGHTDNADRNAALNILDRFLTGPYGAGYQPLTSYTHNRPPPSFIKKTEPCHICV